MGLSIWTYAFEPPGPEFSDSDLTKFDWPEIPIDSIDLANYSLFHEVLGAIVYFTDISPSEEMGVYFKAYNNDTGALLFETQEYISPGPYAWYKTKFWVGYATWELYQSLSTRLEIYVTGAGYDDSQILYMNVFTTYSLTIHTVPNDATIYINDVQQAELTDATYYTADNTPWIRIEKAGYKTFTAQPSMLPPGIEFTVELEEQTIRNSVNAVYSSPEPHNFILSTLYGTDTDGTPEGFFSEAGVIVNWFTVEGIVNRTDNLDLTFSPEVTGTYDALTAISEEFPTIPVGIYDWKIDHDAITL